MKIKYVGLKDDGETAFSKDPGAPAIWFKGDSFEVPEAIAKRMLQHPDVFELDAGTATKTEEQTKPEEVDDEYAGLSKEELHALAKERGITVHHAAGAAKVAKALRAATKTEEPAQ